MAAHKTKFICYNKKIIPPEFEINILGTDIKPSENIKYLGVLLNKFNNYYAHVDKITGYASVVMGELSRIMGNTRGPKYSDRRLYYNIITSILGYASPIWAPKALKVSRNKKKLAKIQRISLRRVACNYRTAGRLALCVITGFLPIEITLEEKKWLYEVTQRYKILHTDDDDLINWKNENLKLETERITNRIWNHWYNKWNNTVQVPESTWTRRLIPSPRWWAERNKNGKAFGQLNFRLTQMLTGHGVFKSYLHRIRKADSDECWWCQGVRDDPEHTLVSCTRWAVKRNELERKIGTQLVVSEFMDLMILNPENWRYIDTFINYIMIEKEKFERKKEKEVLN